MARLREVRAQRVLTIRALAAHAGVATRTVVEVEAGRVVPRFATVRKLSEALGVEPGEVDEFRAAIDAAAEDPSTTERPRQGQDVRGGTER